VRGFSVLLVDGSVSVRRMLTDALEGDPRVGTVASAANAKIALAKIPRVNPDVVLVDLDLPEDDPFLTVRQIRRSYPDLPVVVDSEHTHRGADMSLRALAAGATRCVSRPTGLARHELVTRARDALVPVLVDVCGDRVEAEIEVLPANAVVKVNGVRVNGARQRPRRAPQVLALAASTGGPDALETVLAGLPASFPLPIVVVQHMPAGFTAQFARRLASRSHLAVDEARDMDLLRMGRVLLAPGGRHMRVARTAGARMVRLDDGTPENFCRPSVDVLFRSVAASYGDAALAVVLTGMGADGMRGAGELVHAGAEVLIQDEDSSTVWGMPGAVSNAGLASEVLALDDIAPAVLQRVGAAAREGERR
jgi:two-component system chemotaxis response regulator CheB